MRKLFILSLLSFFSFISFAQDASSYFPANPGFTWNFKVIPLDSANQEVDAAVYYQVDSFAVAQELGGRSADVIISRIIPGLQQMLSLYDTNYISFDGSDAYTYYKPFNIDSLISSLASGNLSSNSLVTSSVGEWLPYYKFAQPENLSYPILSVDTPVVFSGFNLKVNFETKGMRLADENISTDVGMFNCKKFVIDDVVNVFLPPFPAALSTFTFSDTVWITSNMWIVQDFMPSTLIDLSFAGLGTQTFPGSKKTMISEIPTGINDVEAKVNEFELYQNYPNPFNPSTTIRYSIPENSNVEITIYDILGNKITTLINKEQNAGNHEVEFNPSLIKGGISSGIYFYTLKTGQSLITKKLVYLK